MSAPTTTAASATTQIIGASAGAVLVLLLLVGGTIGLCLKYRPAGCFTPSTRLQGTRKWNYNPAKPLPDVEYENERDSYEQLTPLDSFNMPELRTPVELQLPDGRADFGSVTEKSERKDSSASSYSLNLGERESEGDYFDATLVREAPQKPKKMAPGRPARPT